MTRPSPSTPGTHWIGVLLVSVIAACLLFWSGVTAWVLGDLNAARWFGIAMGACVIVGAIAWRLDTLTKSRWIAHRIPCGWCGGRGRLDDIVCSRCHGTGHLDNRGR